MQLTLKKVISLVIIMTMLLSCFDNAMASQFNYKEIIKPQYEFARGVNDGLAAVKKDGKWGYIDVNGKVMIPFSYDIAYSFSEGYAVVGFIKEKREYEHNTEIIMSCGCIDMRGNNKQFTYSDYEGKSRNFENFYYTED